MIKFPRTYHSPHTLFGVIASGAVGFTPADLPNLHSWWDASDFSTITKDGSDRVSQWNDKSGNVHHLLQAAGGSQPLWLSANKNGLDTIDFAGSRWMNDTFSSISQPITIYMACITPAETAVSASLFDGNTINQSRFAKSSAVNQYFMISGATMTNTQAGLAGLWNYNTTIWNGVSSDMRFGGTSIGTGNAGTNALTGFTVMTAGSLVDFGNELVGEMIIQDALATAQEISDTENYLLTKWAL